MQQEKRGLFPYNYRGGCFFNVFNLAITGKRFCTKRKDPLLASLFSGAKESRTPDLLHAMQALYQLSYNPEDAHKYRMSCCACQG